MTQFGEDAKGLIGLSGIFIGIGEILGEPLRVGSLKQNINTKTYPSLHSLPSLPEEIKQQINESKYDS